MASLRSYTLVRNMSSPAAELLLFFFFFFLTHLTMSASGLLHVQASRTHQSRDTRDTLHRLGRIHQQHRHGRVPMNTPLHILSLAVKRVTYFPLGGHSRPEA